jgi:hypothetical protein
MRPAIHLRREEVFRPRHLGKWFRPEHALSFDTCFFSSGNLSAMFPPEHFITRNFHRLSSRSADNSSFGVFLVVPAGTLNWFLHTK